jgi:hypothetical protein
MANYDVRAPQDYAFGQLSAGISTSDTTLSSARFANLPSDLTTTKYLPITLTDAINGLLETVWITAHTASSTSVTVVRAREGTTAQSWASSTPWTCAATVRDGLSITTRAGLPTDPYIGQRVYVSDESQVVERISGAWTNGPMAGGVAMYNQSGDQAIGTGADTVAAFATDTATTPLISKTTSGAGHMFVTQRAGVYLMCATVRMRGSAASREMYVGIELFGGGRIGAQGVPATANFPTTHNAVALYSLPNGQGIRVMIFQSSGASISTEAAGCIFEMAWLRD